MPNAVAHLYSVAFTVLAAAAPATYAVCLDPKTLISGYHVPLDEEVRSRKVIVIGKVVRAEPLQEDATDPEGITAYIYTVQVLRQLKGHLPKVITLRTENDSGRYPMDVGEQHLLFLSAEGKHFVADSCGNSSLLPRGRAVLKSVEAELAKTSNAP